jgi:glycosyltransferase involved in cell wall biosynthesis
VKIWLIQTGEDIPLDDNIRKLRTAVLAEELVSRGHQVTWWASAFSHLRKEWIERNELTLELPSGVNVELLHGRGYKSNVSLARVIDHRIVAAQFKKRSAESESPDIIVSSLPPYDLAYQAAQFSKQRGIPLLVDARDCWPDIFVDVAPAFLRPLMRLVLQSEFRLTRSAFRQADAITAVSSDMLNWALSYCDREPRFADRVIHLGFHSPPAGVINVPDWLAALDGKFIVAFIGTFSSFHSPVVLARAARQLAEEGRDDIAIVIAGAGGDIQDKVQAEAAGLRNVTLPGWLDQAGIDALLDRAAVGVCPTSTDAKLFPNKTFLYFSSGLPVLSAFQGELRQVLGDDGLGFYFDRDDAAALVGHIKVLCDNSALYSETSERVRKVFSERYDEQVIYSAFADHIEALANARR